MEEEDKNEGKTRERWRVIDRRRKRETKNEKGEMGQGMPERDSDGRKNKREQKTGRNEEE